VSYVTTTVAGVVIWRGRQQRGERPGHSGGPPTKADKSARATVSKLLRPVATNHESDNTLDKVTVVPSTADQHSVL
jgi:hypothetical protein